MTTRYDETAQTTNLDTLVSWAATRLRNDSTLMGYLQGGKVFEHRLPTDDPNRSIVVRVREDVGGRSVPFTALDNVPLQAAIYTFDEEPDIDKFHWAVRDRVYARWTDQEPSLSGMRVVRPLLPLQRGGPPRWYSDAARWISVATYSVVLANLTRS